MDHGLYNPRGTLFITTLPLISTPGTSLSGGRFVSLLEAYAPVGSHYNADPPGVYVPSVPINLVNKLTLTFKTSLITKQSCTYGSFAVGY